MMSGPYGLVTQQQPVDKERRINVHFRLPFMTKWGQSLIVTGSGTSNGAKGKLLSCSTQHILSSSSSDSSIRMSYAHPQATVRSQKHHTSCYTPTPTTVLAHLVQIPVLQVPCWAI